MCSGPFRAGWGSRSGWGPPRRQRRHVYDFKSPPRLTATLGPKTDLNRDVVLSPPLKNSWWIQLPDVQDRFECHLQEFTQDACIHCRHKTQIGMKKKMWVCLEIYMNPHSSSWAKSTRVVDPCSYFSLGPTKEPSSAHLLKRVNAPRSLLPKPFVKNLQMFVCLCRKHVLHLEAAGFAIFRVELCSIFD